MITTKDRGQLKSSVRTMLFLSDAIKEMLIGDFKGTTTEEQALKFRQRCKSHLFVEETLSDPGTYIFYDVVCPQIYAHTKKLKMVMYVVCHRDNLDNYFGDGYTGNRVDALSQMVEEALLNKKSVGKFGIGELSWKI